jgi:hypothetical protein
MQSGSEATTVAGKWNFSMGPQKRVLVLNLDGNKVTGTLGAEGGTADKLQGEYVEGKLTFTVMAEAMNRDGSDAGRVAIKYEGRLTNQGSLAGTATIEGFDSAKTWTAVRPG